MIIHINGMPGVGKLTVAKILAEKLQAYLIDNHVLIDLATTISERGGQQYFQLIEKFMNSILETIPQSPDKHYIFTNAFIQDLPNDRKRFHQILDFAQFWNISFVQILLSCELDENKKRLLSENRKQKGKLLDPAILHDLQKYTIYHPDSDIRYELDTTMLIPEESASKIIDFLKYQHLS